MLFVAGVGALICGRGLATSFAFAGTCHASDVCLRMLSHSVRTTHREFEPSPDGCAIFSTNKLISARFAELPACRMGSYGRSPHRARPFCNIGPTQEFATASFVVPAISTHIPLCYSRQIATLARATVIDIEDCQIHSDNVLCHMLIRLTGWIGNWIAACSVWNAGCSEISGKYKIERGDRREGERTFPGTQIHPAAKWRPMGNYCTA